jgi:hypothetical protein
MALEITIFIFSIFGAFGLSSLKKEMRMLGFISFIISNVFIILLSLNNDIYPLALQMVLLTIFSFVGIYNIYYSKNINVNFKYIILLYVLLFSILLLNIDYKTYFSNVIHKYEIVLSLVVLIGNSFITTSQEDLRVRGFYMFIVADIGYIFLYSYYALYIMVLTTLLFFLASFKAVYAYQKKTKEFNYVV